MHTLFRLYSVLKELTEAEKIIHGHYSWITLSVWQNSDFKYQST